MKIAHISIVIICLLLFSFSNYQYTLSTNDNEFYISHNILNFNRCFKTDLPSMTFFVGTLFNKDENFHGNISTSADWIHISTGSCEGISTEVRVTLDLFHLKPNLYHERLTIKSNKGEYSLPVKVEVIDNKAMVMLQIDNLKVIVNNVTEVTVAAPFIKDSIIRAPLRVICDAFEAKVYYNNSTHQIIVNYMDDIVKVTYDEDYVIINNEKQNLPYKIELINRNGITFIPLPFFRDIMNLIVSYNNDYRFVTITY